MKDLLAAYLPPSPERAAVFPVPQEGELSCRFDADDRLVEMISNRDGIEERVRIHRDPSGRPTELKGDSRYGPMAMAFSYAPHGQIATMQTDKTGDGKFNTKMEWIYEGGQQVAVESDFDADGSWDMRTLVDARGWTTEYQKRHPDGSIERARVTSHSEGGRPENFEVIEE